MPSRRTFNSWAGAALLAASFWHPALAADKAEIPKQKGTLVFAVDSLAAQTLDPILEGRPGNAVYQAAMYDSLVGFDTKKGGVGPGVAERWELSDDGLTWTFHLRPDQKFHNGDKLTAAGRQVQPRTPDEPGIAVLGEGDAEADHQGYRGRRRADRQDPHQRARRSACRRC